MRVKYLCKRVGSVETFNLFADKVLMLGGGGAVELGDGRHGLTLPVADHLNKVYRQNMGFSPFRGKYSTKRAKGRKIIVFIIRTSNRGENEKKGEAKLASKTVTWIKI